MPTKNYKAYKETGRYGSFTRKKKLTENLPEETGMLDVPDKEFKLTALNMLKLLKESWTKNQRNSGE